MAKKTKTKKRKRQPRHPEDAYGLHLPHHYKPGKKRMYDMKVPCVVAIVSFFQYLQTLGVDLTPW